MLKMNLSRLFKLRGITKPQKYLMQKGMSYSTSYWLSRDKFTRYNNDVMEKLCYILNCTPNDLFEFRPDKEYLKDEKLELHKLSKTQVNLSEIKTILEKEPVEKLETIYKKIKEM
jgi:DNA-binding Xre family transcriptional regulator